MQITSRRFFLYVGTRGFCKNFEFVLQFLKASRDEGIHFPLVVVGGPSFTPNEIKGFERNGLSRSDFVHLVRANDNDLRRLYSNAIALLIPSRYEGFGFAAEAARCKCLVLAASGSALEEIVGVTEYSFDLQKHGEAQRVISLGFDNLRADVERERLYQRSQLFDWELSAKKQNEVYYELFSRS